MQKLSYSKKLNQGDKRVLEEWKRLDAHSDEEQLAKVLYHTWVDLEFTQADKDKAYDSFLQSLSSEEDNKGAVDNTEVKTINIAKYFKVAAVALLLVTAGLFAKNAIIGSTILLESGDQIVVEMLPDGTSITLDKYSQLEYKQKWFGKREANFIKGKALFEVAKNPSRPFVTKTPNGLVSVLGTEYVVDLTDDKQESVTVREGKVAYSADNTDEESKLELVAKEKAVFNLVKKSIIKKKRRSNKDFGWLYNKDNSTSSYLEYSEFVDQLEDDFGVSIDDKDVSKQFASCKLSYHHLDNNAEVLIDILRRTNELNIQRFNNNTQWRFSGGRCK